ncbi:50S ribosomal protein L20 [Gemmiger formicilis]|uniref:50S ribosomal protein L20 n=1 Tax=Gemmiger formicilis TaxID=745368 RepID=UPI003CCAD929
MTHRSVVLGTLKLARSYYGAKSKHFPHGQKQAVMKSSNYLSSAVSRRRRQFHNLWITHDHQQRCSCSGYELLTFMNGLKAGVEPEPQDAV